MSAICLTETPSLDNSYSMLEAIAEEVFEVTGWDRIMIYEFDDEWNGTVAVRYLNVFSHCE